MKEDIIDVEKKAAEQATATATKISILRKTIEDNTKSNKERIKALNELRGIVPAYHAQLTTEGKLINNNTNALDAYIVNLRRAAKAQAVVAKMNEIAQQELDNQLERNHEKGVRNHVSNQAYRQGINLHTMKVREKQETVYVNGGAITQGSGRYEVIDKATGKVVAGLENVSKSMLALQNRFDEQTAKMARSDAQTQQNNRRMANLEDLAKKEKLDLTSEVSQKVEPTKPVKTGGSGTKEDSRALSDYKLARQKELDASKATYEEELVALKKSLADKKITRKEYDSLALASEIAYKENVLKVEQRYQKDSESLQIKDAEKKKEIQADQNRNVQKALDDSNQARLQAYAQYQSQMQALRDSSMSEADREKADRDAQLAVLDAYYKASLQYAEENKKDTLAVDNAYFAARERLEEDWRKKDEERKFRARSSAGLTTVQEELQYGMAGIDTNTDLSPEEKNRAKENLEREHQERLLQIRQEYGLVKHQELYDMELEQLRLAHEQGMLSEEEYEEAKKNMKMQKWKESFDYYHGLFSNAVSALQDAELANVDAKYDAEIEAARKAGKDTTKLEEKKAREQLEIQKKYADINFAIKASQIIADTATSIMKAYADLGPIAGSIAAALMGVTGIAQLMAANAERQKVKRMTLNGGSSSSSASAERVATGKEEGGFLDVEREQDGRRFHAKYDPRRRGYVDRPTVIVGEGPVGQSKEWIASNAAVENPTVRPVLDVLDRSQRAGTIRTLDLNKFLIQHRGFAEGGSVSSASLRVPPTGFGMDPELMERFIALMERMERNGIPAHVGLDEIDNQNKLLEQSRNIGSK